MTGDPMCENCLTEPAVQGLSDPDDPSITYDLCRDCLDRVTRDQDDDHDD